MDPDSEIITATRVTPGNAGDASAAEDLIDDLLTNQPADQPDPARSEPAGSGADGGEEDERATVYGDYADPVVMPTSVRTCCSAGVPGRKRPA